VPCLVLQLLAEPPRPATPSPARTTLTAIRALRPVHLRLRLPHLHDAVGRRAPPSLRIEVRTGMCRVASCASAVPLLRRRPAAAGCAARGAARGAGVLRAVLRLLVLVVVRGRGECRGGRGRRRVKALCVRQRERVVRCRRRHAGRAACAERRTRSSRDVRLTEGGAAQKRSAVRCREVQRRTRCEAEERARKGARAPRGAMSGAARLGRQALAGRGSCSLLERLRERSERERGGGGARREGRATANASCQESGCSGLWRDGCCCGCVSRRRRRRRAARA
jgi:hypothetical protein